MTQRVELAALIDRLAIDTLITDYAGSVDDGDWDAYQQLFTPEGRADYRSAGGIEGSATEVSAWLAETMRMFAIRQHFIVNRRLRFGVREQDVGDTARVRADYLNPMRFAGEPDAGPATAPDLTCGGRYEFTALRTHGGWRLRQVVVREKWRSTQAAGRTWDQAVVGQRTPPLTEPG
ncbi:nuclear transport factor 2 family protein [Streptomyces sp. MNP-20]|uniref:nuclear transport factor 2 family protein n=1 Tax=Streptomyces sp. MNP-20 TaxID=2721165 RepID=UPI0015557117|nr:nuclear transport factor 2 family protein [Streptomyces sp. MNP-20]